jgi:hypothetical protein
MAMLYQMFGCKHLVLNPESVISNIQSPNTNLFLDHFQEKYQLEVRTRAY